MAKASGRPALQRCHGNKLLIDFQKFPPALFSSLLFSSFSSLGKSLPNNLMANRVGVDMLAFNNSSTFLRLYPVLRDPTA